MAPVSESAADKTPRPVDLDRQARWKMAHAGNRKRSKATAECYGMTQNGIAGTGCFRKRSEKEQVCRGTERRKNERIVRQEGQSS